MHMRGWPFCAASGVAQRYGPRNQSWELLSAMPQARYCTAAATMQERIYVFGGRHGFLGTADEYLPTLECFDPTSGAWQTLSAMPASLETCFSVAALRGSTRMYLIGHTTELRGRGSSRLALSCFDASSGSWETLPYPKPRRCAHWPTPSVTATPGTVLGTSVLSVDSDFRP